MRQKLFGFRYQRRKSAGIIFLCEVLSLFAQSIRIISLLHFSLRRHGCNADSVARRQHARECDGFLSVPQSVPKRILAAKFPVVLSRFLIPLHQPLRPPPALCICNERISRCIHDPLWFTSVFVLEEYDVRYGNKLP